MNTLASALESTGLQYFRAADEFLLVFRGRVLDHHIILKRGESFLHGACVLGRAPSPLPGPLAERLLQWNGGHSLSRIAITDNELVLLAELPLQGVDAHAVEELVMSIATAAEQLKPEILPLLLEAGGPAPVNSSIRPGETTPDRRPLAAPVDPEIDWEAEDV